MAKEKEIKDIVEPTEPTVEEKETKPTEPTEFHVYDADGRFVRTYSVAIHGEDAGKLAKQFSTNPGNEGYTIK